MIKIVKSENNKNVLEYSLDEKVFWYNAIKSYLIQSICLLEEKKKELEIKNKLININYKI